MGAIRLRVMGGFGLWVGDAAAPLLPRKARALLAYLAVQHPRAVAREVVGELLWPGRGAEQVRHSLRQALTDIRRAAAGILVARDDSLALGEGVSVEAGEGALLEGFAPVSADFDDWLAQTRAQMQNRALVALEPVAVRNVAAGDGAAALAAAERMLALDPLREDTHRLVLRACVAAGRRAEALRHYRRFVDLLRRELGVAPDPETRALVRELRLDEEGGEVVARNAVAVLAFARFSGDEAEGYFADGVVDDVITELSYFRSLFVIARSSSFSFRDARVDMREIGAALGVDYLVEGSVRRAGHAVRVTARLVFARTGVQLWAEKFDAPWADIFALQDAISRQIACAIEPRILAFEADRTRAKPTARLDAYDWYLRGLPHCEGFSGEAFTNAIRMFGDAIRLDPTYAAPLAAAAVCHTGLHDQGWLRSGVDHLGEGVRLAEQALRHGADDAVVLCKAGHALAAASDDRNAARVLLDRALEINPNYAEAWMRSSMIRVFLDDSKGAIAHAEKALALSPRDSRLFMPLCAKAYGHLFLGEYDAAAEMATRALASGRRPEMAHRILITAHWKRGRTEEMQRAARALMTQIPGFRISGWRTRKRLTGAERFDPIMQALYAANLPE